MLDRNAVCAFQLLLSLTYHSAYREAIKAGRVHCFYGGSVFSNFHRDGALELAGVLYRCAEQAYQAEKARFFGDTDTAGKIMAETRPSVMKQVWCLFEFAKAKMRLCQMAKEIRGFDADKWAVHKKTVMEVVISAKVQQNSDVRQALFDLWGTALAEASPAVLYFFPLSSHLSPSTSPRPPLFTHRPLH